MSFEVDRYPSAWAHVALCANLTWATEPPDEFIIANQRLWAQHLRVNQVLQDSTAESQSHSTINQIELTDKRQTSSQNQENGSCSGRRSVKDIIPESRLAQYNGNFYYDETREQCYTNASDKISLRGSNGQGCENTDLTECWMLPEVEYWFRKLQDDPADCSIFPRRRRQYRMLADDDLCVLVSFYYSSERWGRPCGAGEEAVLAARVSSVRALWGGQPRAPSPPAAPRKMRARRRQPRRLAVQTPLAYCLETPVPLCDPSCKFQFDAPPRPPQLRDCQRSIGRLSASVQAVMRATARCPPYRGTNISRYAPTCQRPSRYPERKHGVWWPRDHLSQRIENRLQLNQMQQTTEIVDRKQEDKKTETATEIKDSNSNEQKESLHSFELENVETQDEKAERPKTEHDEKVMNDDQTPSTSSAVIDAGLRKKRLYSTVLSMSAPAPINLSQVGCVRLSQKLVTPGLLKLNPKIVLPAARIRPPNVDNKFEELEKEALEQYKASDESIDTKFRELEKQAVEQYNTSNSNTSCSSGNSGEKKTVATLPVPETEQSKKQVAKFQKDKSVDSVVIYSQNFPEQQPVVNKNQTNSGTNLKNFHNPPRGEKKEQVHRTCKNARSIKSDSQKAASDTDDMRESNFKGSHKGPLRWTLHVVPPKKRHLSMCVSDFSSDEDVEESSGAIRDAGPRLKTRAGNKVKMSAHGGGDLHPIVRKM